MKKYFLTPLGFMFIICVAQTDSTDMIVDYSTNFVKSEVHIALNRHDPNKILIGWNSKKKLSSFTSQGWAFSNNHGKTFCGNNNFPENNILSAVGDPVVGFDASENPYMFTMDGNTGGVGFINSTNPCNGWSSALLIKTSSTTQGKIIDKIMGVAVDDNLRSSGHNNIYIAGTDFSTTPASLVFSRRIAGVGSFEKPITLSAARYSQGANVQVGIENKVYVCWTDYGPNAILPGSNIGFAVSTDNGENFNSNYKAFNICGIRLASTYENVGQRGKFCNTRVNDYPSMAVDRSCLSRRGRVYICWSDQLNCTASPSNKGSVIKMRYTDNDGLTWSNPISISKPDHPYSWMPSISVDERTGLVTVAYMSFKDDCDETNIWLSYSSDNGLNWSHLKVSDVSHKPNSIRGAAADYAGDYIGQVTYNNIAYVAWHDNRSGSYEVYLSKVGFSMPRKISYAYGYVFADSRAFNEDVQIFAKESISFNPGVNIIVNPGFKFHLRSEKSIEVTPDFLVNNENAILEIGPVECYDVGTTLPPPLGAKKIIIDSNKNNVVKFSRFNIFPNPSATIIHIQNLQPNGSFFYQVYNEFGRLVSSGKSDSGETVSCNLEYFPEGIYFVKINNEETRKIIIIR